MSEKKDYKYGGMALIEGVMMRGPEKTAMAVRKSDGSIHVEMLPNHTFYQKYPFLKWPLIRGVASLIESMVVGMKALNQSANLSLEDEGEELSTWELVLTMLVAFALAIALFMALPAALVHFTQKFIGGIILQNIVEGIIRVAVFLLYVYAISKTPDIKRVLMYHGAEHKTIAAQEAGVELTPENIRPFPRLHPRCGTSFLLLVMIISIIIHIFLGSGTLAYRLLSRLAVFPVVAGVSYEFLKFSAACSNRPWVKFLVWPGLQLQRLTTSEPDDSMLEVAIVSLRASMPEEEAAKIKLPESAQKKEPTDGAEAQLTPTGGETPENEKEHSSLQEEENPVC